MTVSVQHPKETPVDEDEQTPADKQESEQPADKQEQEQEQEPAFNKDALIKDLHTERDRRKALQAQVEQLKAAAATVKDAESARDAVQRKYDRLESILLSSGTGLAAMLDSRTFSTKLFETDTPVDRLLEEWNKANPSQTGKALSSQGAAQQKEGPSLSELLQAAIQQKR